MAAGKANIQHRKSHTNRQKNQRITSRKIKKRTPN